MSDKFKKFSSEEKYIISQYLEEWKLLNQYINDIDKGYVNFITIFTAIATAAATLISVAVEISGLDFTIFFYILPMALVAIFGYMGYQFRITAILRGHLAGIEDKINDMLGDSVFMWNSSLVEVYMAHNNVPNNTLMIPIVAFVLLIVGICFYGTLRNGLQWFDIVYWIVIFLLGLLVLIPFFFNEAVRKKTYNSREVISKYEDYKKNE